MGFQGGSSVGSDADKIRLVQLIIREYITFPILFSTNNFFEMGNGTHYILFKDFINPVIYDEKEVDLGAICKAIEELTVEGNGKSIDRDKLKSTWSKPIEIINEPRFCSSLQNLLLYFPGYISADKSGKRLFLSDSDHHRIIIFSSDGTILDCVSRMTLILPSCSDPLPRFMMLIRTAFIL